MKFNKNKLKIINRCKEKGASNEELIKLINSKNSNEFWEVIINNLSWFSENEIITKKDNRKVKDRILTKMLNEINDNKFKVRWCIDIKDRKELK